jgi:hypothetical protein
MKKISITGLILFKLVYIYSQTAPALDFNTNNDSLSKSKKLLWGIYISPDYSNKLVNNVQNEPFNKSNNNINYTSIGAQDESGIWSSHYYYDKRFEKPILGWNLGIKALKRFSKYFAYSFGLLLDRQGFATNTIDSAFGGDMFNVKNQNQANDTFVNRYQFNYITYFMAFPISIEYLFLRKNKCLFYFNFESSLHLLIFDDVIRKDVINNTNSSLLSGLGSGSSLGFPINFINLYSTVSINAMFPFKNFTLGLEPYFRYAVIPNYSNGYTSSIPNGISLFNYATADIHFYQIGLSVVYYFSKGR